MFLFSFLALVVTSATAVIFGAPIADPVAVLSKIGGAGPTLMGLFGLAVATLSTNIAANVVAPANAFVNLNPQKLSFRTGKSCSFNPVLHELPPLTFLPSRHRLCVLHTKTDFPYPTFAPGGVIAATLGAIVCPWNLIGSTGGYIFVWLVGYSALLGPVVGIMLVDYFIVRRNATAPLPRGVSPFALNRPVGVTRILPDEGDAHLLAPS